MNLHPMRKKQAPETKLQEDPSSAKREYKIKKRMGGNIASSSRLLRKIIRLH